MAHMPRVLVPVADGYEEIETVNIVDILRRAEVEVIMASIMRHQQKNLIVVGSRNIKLVCDADFYDCYN